MIVIFYKHAYTLMALYFEMLGTMPDTVGCVTPHYKHNNNYNINYYRHNNN